MVKLHCIVTLQFKTVKICYTYYSIHYGWCFPIGLCHNQMFPLFWGSVNRTESRDEKNTLCSLAKKKHFCSQKLAFFKCIHYIKHRYLSIRACLTRLACSHMAISSMIADSHPNQCSVRESLLIYPNMTLYLSSTDVSYP